jgi:hypothetical protein
MMLQKPTMMLQKPIDKSEHLYECRTTVWIQKHQRILSRPRALRNYFLGPTVPNLDSLEDLKIGQITSSLPVKRREEK